MGTPATELQKAVFDALVASVEVGDLVDDRIFDRRPQDGDYPCLTFGPSDTVRDDLNCIDLETVSLQIDVWTRDGGRLHLCRTLTDTVAAALHHADLALETHALALLEVALVRVMQDPDGLTAHGVVTIEAEIERL